MIRLVLSSNAPGNSTLCIVAETSKEKAAIRKYHPRGSSQIVNNEVTERAEAIAEKTIDSLRRSGHVVVGKGVGFSQFWSK